jgi:hypothetical protein
MKSRAETLLEGFKLGSLGVSKPKTMSFERKHNPVEKKMLKVKWGFSFVVPPGKEPRIYQGKPVYAYATWEQGIRDEWVHYWGGPLDYDENRYSRIMILELWVGKSKEDDTYFVNLEIFYNYDKSIDMCENHIDYIRPNKQSPVIEVVLEDFKSLSKRAEAEGLTGIKWPLEWSPKK